MIDALEALIEHLYSDADLNAVTEGRIAPRHKYGDGWPIPCQALQVQYDGGDAESYLEWQRPRIEFRCYGGTFAEASAVYRALVAVSRRAQRRVVETSAGKALVYWMNLTSGASFLQEPDVRDVYMVLVYGELAVAGTACCIGGDGS